MLLFWLTRKGRSSRGTGTKVKRFGIQVFGSLLDRRASSTLLARIADARASLRRQRTSLHFVLRQHHHCCHSSLQEGFPLSPPPLSLQTTPPEVSAVHDAELLATSRPQPSSIAPRFQDFLSHTQRKTSSGGRLTAEHIRVHPSHHHWEWSSPPLLHPTPHRGTRRRGPRSSSHDGPSSTSQQVNTAGKSKGPHFRIAISSAKEIAGRDTAKDVCLSEGFRKTATCTCTYL